MSTLIEFLKNTARLSAVPLMLASFGIGVALLYARPTARWGRRWLTAVVAVYWVLSTPFGSWAVARPIAGAYKPIASREEAQGAQAVVMLGGGTVARVAGGAGLDDLGPSALRVIEAARVYHLLGDPLLIVSGGDPQHFDPPRPEARAYRTAAIALGVPADRIVVEDRSMTTRDEAILLKPMLAERHIRTFVLVTSPTHMGRSLAAFRAVGLNPVPSTAPLRSERPRSFWTLMPDRESLNVSDSALYDSLAFAYYAWHGWLTTAAN